MQRRTRPPPQVSTGGMPTAGNWNWSQPRRAVSRRLRCLQGAELLAGDCPPWSCSHPSRRPAARVARTLPSPLASISATLPTTSSTSINAARWAKRMPHAGRPSVRLALAWPSVLIPSSHHPHPPPCDVTIPKAPLQTPGAATIGLGRSSKPPCPSIVCRLASSARDRTPARNCSVKPGGGPHIRSSYRQAKLH